MNKPIAIGAFPPKNDYLWVTWSLLLECNYTCRYCHVKSSGRASRKIIDDTISFLKKAPQNDIEVTLFGGEPTIHEDLLYIVDKLSFCKTVYIFTNLSCSNSLIEQLVKKNVSFCISYHSDIIKPEHFLSKLEFLLSKSGSIEFINVMMVAEKEYENDIVLKYCRDHQIKHRMLPIWQEGGSIDWLQSVIYSRRPDVVPIRDTIVVKDNKKVVLSEQECIALNIDNFKGYDCYAGMRSVYIDHNGHVYRCQADMNESKIFCSVTDNYPELDSYTCPYDKCTCEYYIPKEIIPGTCNNWF